MFIAIKPVETIMRLCFRNGENHLYNDYNSPSDFEMSDMKLEPLGVRSGALDFYQLLASLKSDNELEFLQEINNIASSNQEKLKEIFVAVDNDDSLMTLACKNGQLLAVERMLRLGADINRKIDTDRGPLNPVESTCAAGSWKVLEILLKSPMLDLNESGPIVSIVVKHLGERKVTEKCNYEECFKMLLEHQHINVNQLDGYGCSALHYAVKFNNSDAIMELLKRGSYIGQKNKYNQLPISNMNPELLEKYFDNCISTNEFREGEDEFEIQFDYTSLVPIATRHFNGKKSNNIGKKSMECCPSEMITIEYMSESNELRHLIRHPLIASFLFLKWNQLAFVFYLNFILCFLFAISTILFTLICYNQDPEVRVIKDIMRIVTMVLACYVIVRELSQFRLSPLTYFRDVENYMECAIIVLVIMILFDLWSEDWRRTIAATMILLMGIEVFHLAGSLPFWSFSTHYVMLKTVISSFLKSLLLYVILLLSFSLAFFTLLREKPEPRAGFENGELNNFSNLGLSILKTLVMSTGEFEAANIHFELSPWSYIVFVAFLFLISTVLLNLLNGLAVNDIQTIKSEAELTNLIQRCQVLGRYENALLVNEGWWSHPKFMHYFGRDAISVFKKLHPVYRVGIRTNANNQISIPNANNDADPMLCNSCFAYFGQCSRMSDKLIRLANGVMRKVNLEKYKEVKVDPLREEIEKLKASNEELKDSLQHIKYILSNKDMQ